MRKIKSASEVVKHLKSLANAIEALVGSLEENQSDSVLPAEVMPPVNPTKVNIEAEQREKVILQQNKPTLEEVRAAMAAKNKEGHREAVKAILFKYGVNKLTALDSRHYSEVLKEVGEIG